LRTSSLIERGNGTLGKPELDELREGYYRQRAELKEFLSPSEMEEFELRASPLAQELRDRDLVGFLPTEEEFRAIFRIRKEFQEAKFLIVGGVSEAGHFQELRALVQALNLEENVRFLGEIGDIKQVLRECTVFCLPSRSEGFSNALIEAMGCGLPCVATRVGGNAEALEEGKSGYLVASEDAAAMADRILQLLRDPVLARRMGQAARETVRTRFSMDAMMNRLIGIYDELLVAKHV
jgi:glycosyltransferase involved in cell wall biosynthesis